MSIARLHPGGWWIEPGRRFFVTLWVTYFLLALLFNAFTPMGEAPDELAHYRYVRMVYEEHRLPGFRDGLWEGHQAPLYYIAAASWAYLLNALFGCGGRFDGVPTRLNPDFRKGNDLNFLTHNASERLSHWTCAEFSFHGLRMFSALLTLLSIVLTVLLLLEVLPSSLTTVKLAATFVALLPSHVFMSTMLNNDSLVNLLIVASLYCMTRALRAADPGRLAQALGTAAIAVATKLSAIFLFPLLAFVPVMQREMLRKVKDIRFTPTLALALAAGMVLPAAVLLRNYLEWGGLFAITALEKNMSLLKDAGMNPGNGGSIMDYYLREFPAEMARMLLVSYGAINFSDGPALIRLRAYGLAIGIGLVVSFTWQRGLLWRSAARAPLLLLMLGFGLFFLTYLNPGYRYRWLQARYLFDQLPLLSIVVGIGITALWQEAKRAIPRLQDSVIVYTHYGFLLLMNVLVLISGVIEHLYRTI